MSLSKPQVCPCGNPRYCTSGMMHVCGWTDGKACTNPQCPDAHPYGQKKDQVKPQKACRWDKSATGCTKPGCTFYHANGQNLSGLSSAEKKKIPCKFDADGKCSKGLQCEWLHKPVKRLFTLEYI